jgi:hypothetical protein
MYCMWDKAKIKPVPQGERGHFNPGRRQPDHPEHYSVYIQE